MSRILCLASSSKSRRELLDQANVKFFVKSVEIDETKMDENPREYVKRLAKSKVHAVLDASLDNKNFNADIIVGADSVAVTENLIIGKPSDKKDAINILKTLSDRTHEFLTGFYILDINTMNSFSEIERTLVNIIRLTEEEIEHYVKTVKPYSWAGGYSSSKASYIIEKIEGSISNVQGLPMHALKHGIEKLNYQWFDFIRKN